jgi:hypothetical protein
MSMKIIMNFWSDLEFMDECGESLNLAINTVADVLHTLYSEAHTEQRGDFNGGCGYFTPDGHAYVIG